MLWDPITNNICKHFIVGHIMIAIVLFTDFVVGCILTYA